MKKETINKVTMDPHKEVDIFCSHKYKGYYIRGTIFPLLTSFQAGYGQESYAYGYYRFAIIALVKAAYLRRMKKEKKELTWEQWNSYAFTEKEHLKAVRREGLNYLRGPSRPGIYPDEETIENYMKDRTLLINMDEVGIKESEYLTESVRTKKEVILLNMDFVVNKIEIRYPQARKRRYLRRIYAIPAFHRYERGVDLHNNFRIFFYEKYKNIYFKLEYNHLEERDYCTIWNSIGELSYEWIEKKAISKRYLNRLNRVNTSMGDRTYPFTDFCWKFFDDLVDELTTNKLIGKCLHCRDFFIWPRGVRIKKYCSWVTDRKKCAKKAADHRRYERGKPETLEKRRKDITETRALYKRLGIKK